VDISSEYREGIRNQQIAKARSELSAADLEKFRQSRYNQKMFL